MQHLVISLSLKRKCITVAKVCVYITTAFIIIIQPYTGGSSDGGSSNTGQNGTRTPQGICDYMQLLCYML